MSSSLLAGCTDMCGWIAGCICVLSFGSFGVPIKLSGSVDVHPLVMQSFKTIVCFLTSWLVIFLGEPVRWSYWGLASGIFWVPGATCGVYGIRHAGLAVACGTWSSIIVMTSFLFGFVFFKEQIRDVKETCGAFALLLIGLIGMSRYSAPPAATTTTSPPLGLDSSSAPKYRKQASFTTAAAAAVNENIHSRSNVPPSLEIEPLMAAMENEDSIMKGYVLDNDDTKDLRNKDRVVFLGGKVSFTKRQLGILGAVVNGAWGGMNLIPMHFAREQQGLSGASYLISYAGGAMIVNTLIWVFYFAYYYHQKNSFQEAALCMPKWHLTELWGAGLAAGLLYSIGNFTSILTVAYLGQGTGYSFCQMQLFVSGLWGVFYFREIKGTPTILKWFASAVIAGSGIILLSYEHVGGSGGHR